MSIERNMQLDTNNIGEERLSSPIFCLCKKGEIMKLSTLRRSIDKWIPIIIDILKNDFPFHSENQFTIIAVDGHFSATPTAPAMTHIGKREIIICYSSLQTYLWSNYDDIKGWYADYLSHINFNRDKYERTTIIEVLIHEICHLYQFMPPTKFISSHDNTEKYTRLFEHPTYFHAYYLYLKHYREFMERLDTLICGGPTNIYFIAACNIKMNKNERYLYDEIDEGLIDSNWHEYAKMVIMSWDEFGHSEAGFPVTKDPKFRIASRDHIVARTLAWKDYEEACKLAERIYGDNSEVSYDVFYNSYYEYRKRLKTRWK